MDPDVWAFRIRGVVGWSWRARSSTSPTGWEHSTVTYVSRAAALAAGRQWLDDQAAAADR